MNTAEMRAISDADRAAECEKLQRELLGLRCRLALGEDVKPSEVRRLRREIARLRTVQREVELAAASAAPAAGGEKSA